MLGGCNYKYHKLIILDLTTLVTVQEVKLALFEMHPKKKHNDQMEWKLFFLQKLWDRVKGDLTRMANDFLFDGIIWKYLWNFIVIH